MTGICPDIKYIRCELILISEATSPLWINMHVPTLFYFSYAAH